MVIGKVRVGKYMNLCDFKSNAFNVLVINEHQNYIVYFQRKTDIHI